MEIVGYIASLLIGISLGLVGGGGSILTVPVLVYLFAISPNKAVSYSLFIVGVTSLVGAYNNYRKGFVDVKTVFLFGSASIITVYITRKFIVPLLPEVIGHIGSVVITKSFLLMVLFAILMVAAFISMIKSRKPLLESNIEVKKWIPLVYGLALGLITGFLGAGGGFLLIPALVIFMKLPMKTAIGTSLLIIALNSLIGFLGDLGNYSIDWKFIITVSAIATAGIFIGGYFNQKVKSETLKKGFGWFVLVMGIYIIVKEVFLK